MAKKQKIKKETWLVFYRDGANHLKSYEAPEGVTDKDFAIEACKNSIVALKDFERMEDGTPIVKKLVYV